MLGIEYGKLYHDYLQAGHGKATSTAAFALLSWLNEQRKDRWSEAVNPIDLTHSNPLAWNTKFGDRKTR